MAVFDLKSLQELTTTLPVSELAQKDADGRTVLHSFAASLIFFKAGELSSLFTWTNTSQTVYAQNVRNAVNRAASVRTRHARVRHIVTA